MSEKENYFANLKHDLPAGMVVFLVAVPLCLGIALASGAPLFSGIIAGIVGGTIVALISGSPLGVSGPAAGLAVIVLTAIQDLGGDFRIFLVAVVLAGVLQIVLGILKAGVIGYYFPSSVIKGMLSGIGVIIILKQIPHAFGYDKNPEGQLGFFQPDGHNTLSELGYMLDAISPGAVLISALAMATLILWERPFMKRFAITKVVQGPLVVVSSGILLNLVLADTANLGLRANQVVSIPVADSFVGFFGQFTTPDFSALTIPAIYTIAVTMAVVASLETLLCVEATDRLDPLKRITPTNRELVAQGVGNMVSGLIGGLPVTQVIVRSSANIQSGGRTKAAAFIHGIFLLVCVMAIPKILNLIPLASLAAILFIVGYKLAKPAVFKAMYASGREQFIPFLVTILGIVFTDLLIGIGIGLATAVVYVLWNNYRTPYHFSADDYVKGEPIKIRLSEEVSFLNKASIMHTLEQIPDGAEVIIDATTTRSIHPDVIEIVEDFQTNAKTRNISVSVEGMDDDEKHDPVTHFGRAVLNHPAPSGGKKSGAKS